MTQNMTELEQDIEQTRARLDLTIDRLQDKITDKLSVSGIVDDMLGRGRQTRYAAMYDQTLAVIRRNPVPVMLIAAGVGWLIHRLATDNARPTRTYVVPPRPPAEAGVPVTRTVTARTYDPAVPPPRRPADNTPDSARAGGVRA